MACWTNQYVPPHDLEGEKVSILVKGTITPEGQRAKVLKIDKTASYAASVCTFTQCLRLLYSYSEHYTVLGLWKIRGTDYLCWALRDNTKKKLHIF